MRVAYSPAEDRCLLASLGEGGRVAKWLASCRSIFMEGIIHRECHALPLFLFFFSDEDPHRMSTLSLSLYISDGEGVYSSGTGVVVESQSAVRREGVEERERTKERKKRKVVVKGR